MDLKDLESRLKSIMNQGMKVKIFVVYGGRRSGYVTEVGTDCVALSRRKDAETIGYIIPFNAISIIEL